MMLRWLTWRQILKSEIPGFALFCLSILFLSGCTALPSSETITDSAAWFDAPSVQAAGVVTSACAVTQPVQDQPPDDPHADPFRFGNWHINADRTLWVQIPASGVWHLGGEKAIWIRPAGSELRVSGQRLDQPAEPLLVEQPCCYPTGFQVNGLYFPSAGCWKINATAGEHELRFVIEVRDAAPHTQAIFQADKVAWPITP